MEIQCTKDGNFHTHSTWAQLVSCVGNGTLIARVSSPTPRPTAAGSGPVRPVSGPPMMRHPDADPTGAQLSFISKLGGSWRDAHKGTRAEASQLIDTLKNPDIAEYFKVPDEADAPLDDPAWESFPQERAWRKGELGLEWSSFDPTSGALVNPTSYVPPPQRTPSGYDPEEHEPQAVNDETKLKAMLPLLDGVRDGYFAMDMGDGRPLLFMRMTRPTFGRYKGCIKVQTQHADRLDIAWVHWPSGHVSIYRRGIEEYILMLMSNWRAAARLYAKEIGKCCICNTALTDERSRKYGIGPECEKKNGWYIQMVEEEWEAEREEANQ